MACIVVAIPCFNEVMTIAKVISDFKRELPEARIIVLDNNSSDNSAGLARRNGAEVFCVREQGKGSVVRYLFREIEANFFVLVDGDDTYPAEAVHDMLLPIIRHEADMVVGDRLSNGTYKEENKRGFHNLGNNLVRWLVNICFNSTLSDIMSGYRVFSKRFVLNVPILSNGFEVETEMTISCLDRKLAIKEIPIKYRDRPVGSYSKLNTFSDGFRVIKTIVAILRDYRPFLFFGILALMALLMGMLCGVPVIAEFAKIRYVSHVPLAILSTGLVIVAGLLLSCGLVLNTLVMHEHQRNELLVINNKDGRGHCD